ncbi:hypothetical protein SAMN05428948_3144 [Massilia sp. CF038]|nr:hypothetical protein SAMN05428948_3144 [Massilia sp. CF038]
MCKSDNGHYIALAKAGGHIMLNNFGYMVWAPASARAMCGYARRKWNRLRNMPAVAPQMKNRS